mmetsp:Transcript_208/g.610  ORF Transcript_208/g.610 Transcript_208/m.610 type:complete len:244 (+) Transcript_208:1925-2656(+)
MGAAPADLTPRSVAGWGDSGMESDMSVKVSKVTDSCLHVRHRTREHITPSNASLTKERELAGGGTKGPAVHQSGTGGTPGGGRLAPGLLAQWPRASGSMSDSASLAGSAAVRGSIREAAPGCSAAERCAWEAARPAATRSALPGTTEDAVAAAPASLVAAASNGERRLEGTVAMSPRSSLAAPAPAAAPAASPAAAEAGPAVSAGGGPTKCSCLAPQLFSLCAAVSWMSFRMKRIASWLSCWW